jgi:hypothetical protein
MIDLITISIKNPCLSEWNVLIYLACSRRAKRNILVSLKFLNINLFVLFIINLIGQYGVNISTLFTIQRMKMILNTDGATECIGARVPRRPSA